jgi:hypothetical protein
LSEVFSVGRKPVTIPGRPVQIDGVVRPYVAGETVNLRALLGTRVIKSERIGLKPSRSHRYGTFTVQLSSPKVGTVAIELTHAATPVLGALTARATFTALDPNVGVGSTGRFVQLLQQRLAALHFYIPQSGVFGLQTELALDAYHRLMGWGTYKTVDNATTASLLSGRGQFKVHYPNHGMHAEGDLSDQLLALIDGSKVDMIFPISSGKPSTPTVLGNFHVYARVPGLQSDGMYYSNYFIGGYAIHGYDPAPDYPASHGCMRLPMTDAITVWNWLSYGDAVDVYYG